MPKEGRKDTKARTQEHDMGNKKMPGIRTAVRVISYTNDPTPFFAYIYTACCVSSSLAAAVLHVCLLEWVQCISYAHTPIRVSLTRYTTRTAATTAARIRSHNLQ